MSHTDCAGWSGKHYLTGECRVCWLQKNPDTYYGRPGLLKKLGSVIKATVSHVRQGLPMVDDTEKARRLGICETCPHYVDLHCRRCGCAMKRKAAWALSKCPIGKW